MNFAAQAAAANEKKTAGERAPVTAVELDGGAALKIMTHCADASPGNAAGQLLGLDVGGNLDVTACFPFPRVGGEDDHEGAFAAEEGAEYQLDMMRVSRESNVDSNAVGWYQST